MRSYYDSPVRDFIDGDDSEQLVAIVDGYKEDNNSGASGNQIFAWKEEIAILKDQLRDLTEGSVLFEYNIPCMGMRIDAVLLYKGIVFVLEFKCGSRDYTSDACNQVMDYALYLKDFHKES